ncbi:hypothetical protein K9M79_06620 [Candidatus Woesearchaeota archaeon]|nr:hypothetical protein [Candidatus Woesearchaeota archaeon]
MPRLLFSIPIHEATDVAIDQIDNFKKYNPGCTIIIHISKQFRGRDPRPSLERISNVIVNPERHSTSWGDGKLVDVHISNFNFAASKSSFDYVCLHASNDMFIKSGLTDYVSKYDSGIALNKTHRSDMTKYAKRDRILKQILKNEKIIQFTESQIEGTFYSTELFKKISGKLELYIKLNPFSFPKTGRGIIDRIIIGIENFLNFYRPQYSKEEFYFQTLGIKYSQERAEPYTYFPKRKLTEDQILPLSKDYYAVKGVKRRITDPIRTYINSLELT